MKTSRTRRGNYPKGITRVCIFTLGILIFLGLILLPMAQSIAQVSLYRYLPVILKNAYFGPFTLTPTVTNTAGPSLTYTLTPSPTFTGTITPVPSITVTVSPAGGAKVDEI